MSPSLKGLITVNGLIVFWGKRVPKAKKYGH